MASSRRPLERRPVRWEGKEFTLPGLPSMHEAFNLRPLELEERFMAYKENRLPVVSEKIKSCLCSMLVHYLQIAERELGLHPKERQKILDRFKSSRDWSNILHHSGSKAPPSKQPLSPTQPSEDRAIQAHAPPTQVPPLNAPKGPATSRDQKFVPGNRPTEGALPQRPMSSSVNTPNDGVRKEISHAQKPPPRENASKFWKMPATPSWSLAEMTFKKFVDIFTQANDIDPSRGYAPWETMLGVFLDYVKHGWPSVAERILLSQVSYAVWHSQLRDQIPASALDKFQRRLDQEKSGLRVGFAARITDGRQQQRAGEASRAEGGNKTDIRKRSREDNSGPISPPAKQIKLEPEEHPAGFANKASTTNMEGNSSPSRQLRNAPMLPAVVESDTGLSNGIHLGPSRGQGAVNPTLGPTKSGGEAGATQLLKEGVRSTPAPSPAPSATAWLQANIPLDNQNSHSDVRAPMEVIIKGPALPPIASGDSTLTPGMGIFPTPILGSQAQAASVDRNATTKSIVKLDIILNGALEDLEAMVAEAREPATSEALTMDQQHTVGKVIWSFKSAFKELGALQSALERG